MPKKKPDFDYGTCMACRACELACPFGCIGMTQTDVDSYRKAYPAVGTIDDCTGCGICAQACPLGAVTMR